jgi:hypothetical protein
MSLDPTILQQLAVRVDVTGYVRILVRTYAIRLWAWASADGASRARGTGFAFSIARPSLMWRGFGQLP